MHIADESGRPRREVTLRLNAQEVTELLVAASQIDDGSSDHALVTDADGRVVAVYLSDDTPDPLSRQLDWWLGPVVLIFAILLVVGAFTVARGIITMIF